MNQTFEEVLQEIKHWKTLEIIDGKMYYKITAADLNGKAVQQAFQEFYEYRKNKEVLNYTFNSDSELMILFKEGE